MDLASVVAALASVGVRVSGSNPNNNIQGDSSRACPTGLAGSEPSGTHIDPGQHFQSCIAVLPFMFSNIAASILLWIHSFSPSFSINRPNSTRRMVMYTFK